MRRLHGLICAVLTIFVGTEAQTRNLTELQRQLLADSAKLAQDTCYPYIYRDTNAYSKCIRDLADTSKRASYKKLGVEYFGFAGGLAYRRVGQIGAEQAALEFLKRFRQTQHKLKVSDAEVCASVPGDCTTRIAQMKEMESAPPQAPRLGVRCIGQTCRMEPIE